MQSIFDKIYLVLKNETFGQRNDILPFMTMWIDPEDIIASKVS